MIIGDQRGEWSPLQKDPEFPNTWGLTSIRLWYFIIERSVRNEGMHEGGKELSDSPLS